ncbi:MAG: hypothetical protein JJE04_00340 [Acidobacteriia bacterium]|nr:hypothetical protein [Terriglobia bacterium]
MCRKDMLRTCRKFSTPLWLIALAVVSSLMAPQGAFAQGQAIHGIGVAKNCVGQLVVGQTTNCVITALNNTDTDGDSLTVTGIFDIVQASPINVRVPAAGNLPIIGVTGGATCASANTAFPCNLPPGGTVAVRSNAYVVDADDPDPLPDQGQIVWADQCNGPDPNCNTQSNTSQAPGQSDIVQCLVAADCTSTPGVCQVNTCVANVCGTAPANNGVACGSSADTACSNPDTCLAGICSPNNEQVGFTCGAGTECTDQKCDAAAACVSSNKIDGTTCGSATDTACSNPDTCLAGTCSPNNEQVGFTCGAGTECTDQKCDAAAACVSSSKLDGTACGSATDTICTDPDTCVAGLCVLNNAPGATVCNPGNPATCDPAEYCTAGVCPTDDPGTGCSNAVCRTPGYWSTHAGNDKKNGSAVNTTQAVIALAGGTLNVCGETITNTDLNSINSAVEAMCVSVKGDSQLQLIRQLTAAALNCVISSAVLPTGPNPCAGVPLYAAVFAECNTACIANLDKASITACIDKVDCLNNGGIPTGSGASYFCSTGKCSDSPTANCTSGNLSLCATPGTATCNPNTNNCHNQPLPGPLTDSPAGSSDKCNDAIKNSCEVTDTSCS